MGCSEVPIISIGDGEWGVGGRGTRWAQIWNPLTIQESGIFYIFSALFKSLAPQVVSEHYVKGD